MFSYKGYTGRVEIDTENSILLGEVLDTYDVITFKGVTIEEAKEDFYRVIDDYLENCNQIDKTPDKPFSGRLLYRTSSDTHRKISIAAKRLGKSINSWMDEVLKENIY